MPSQHEEAPHCAWEQKEEQDPQPAQSLHCNTPGSGSLCDMNLGSSSVDKSSMCICFCAAQGPAFSAPWQGTALGLDLGEGAGAITDVDVFFQVCDACH